MSSGSPRLLRRWIIGIPLLLMVACTVLPAQKDTTELFILTPASQAPSSGPPHDSPRRELSIGLGPVNFPGYLKRREIVSRLSGGQLRLSDNKRWAESLDANFQSVLSQDLATRLGTQRIVLFPWYGRPDIEYQIEVQVHRFDADADNRSHLDARWIIKDGQSGRELMAKESNISSTVVATDAAGSEALSGDVNTLSATIAQSLVRVSEGAGTVVELNKPSAAKLTKR
jgi:uncharacterized protein